VRSSGSAASDSASPAFVAGKPPPFAQTRIQEIAKWLADLDATEFADREGATKALASRGRRVERQLREQIRTTTSPEVRRRVKDLLDQLGTTYTADELRALRLVQACEWSATPAARSLLRRWASGEPGAMLTEDARAALVRLERRLR
jgi:hypothetical protein